jgi:pimeloyl-ACP methyl ester carboxylesterase
MSNSVIWEAAERVGLGDSGGYIQKLISVPLNPKKKSDGNFDLYYFSPLPEERKLPEKTVLFCAGGPGRVVKPDDSLWFQSLSANGYRIVFFHLRGSGLSQIPESNEKDRFLRTEYAINDIEEIRKDFLKEKQWDAIVGYSYGAVLAQRYAASEHEDKVAKLVLIGPISLDKFESPADPIKALEAHENKVQEIRRQIVQKVYELEQFGDLTQADKQKIMTELFGTHDERRGRAEADDRKTLGIFRTIERKFGIDQIVIENYGELKERGVLEHFGLLHSREFFESLRKLHLYGWQPLKDPEPVGEFLEKIGKVIAQELGIGPRVESRRRRQRTERPRSNTPRSLRAFEVIGVYDGINRRFVGEWLAGGRKDFRGAIARSAGQAQAEFWVNKQIQRIGIFDQDIASIAPWNPARHRHSRPTLILKGGADPVTAGTQTEHYLKHAINTKKVVLLSFEGVGHEFILPAIDVNSRIVNRVFQGESIDTLDCIVSAFIEKEFDDFLDVEREVANKLKAQEDIPVTAV